MEFRITDTDVYGECKEDFFFAYEGYEKEEQVISSIGYVGYEDDRIPEKTALVMLEENQNQLRNLPKVTELPEPLKAGQYPRGCRSDYLLYGIIFQI